jgi:hypothetical protein
MSEEEAARADSSAAGYQVGGGGTSGMPPASRTAATPTVATPTVASAETATTRRDTARVAASVRGGARTDSATRAAAAAARRDSIRIAAAVRDSVRRDSISRANARRDSIRAARTPPRPTGPVRVNDFLTYDAAAKTVSIQLVAGYTGANGSLNFNGGARGAQGISVPLGWRVHISLQNRSQELQHSAAVVREVLPPPLELPPPAFDGAAIEKLENGLRDGETASFEFVPTRRGRYMLGCGVFGHAEGGMWLRLTVVGSTELPAYR